MLVIATVEHLHKMYGRLEENGELLVAQNRTICQKFGQCPANDDDDIENYNPLYLLSGLHDVKPLLQNF